MVNLTEVLIAPSTDVSRLAAAREAIAALGVTVHQPNEAIGVEAARLRQQHPISLPDAYCLATAKHTGSALSSFDEKNPESSGARRRRRGLSATGGAGARRPDRGPCGEARSRAATGAATGAGYGPVYPGMPTPARIGPTTSTAPEAHASNEKPISLGDFWPGG